MVGWMVDDGAGAAALNVRHLASCYVLLLSCFAFMLHFFFPVFGVPHFNAFKPQASHAAMAKHGCSVDRGRRERNNFR